MAMGLKTGANWVTLQYLNGWVVQRGEAMGVKCWMNYVIVELCKGKANMTRKEISAGIPQVMEEVEVEDDESDLTRRQELRSEMFPFQKASPEESI